MLSLLQHPSLQTGSSSLPAVVESSRSPAGASGRPAGAGAGATPPDIIGMPICGANAAPAIIGMPTSEGPLCGFGTAYIFSFGTRKLTVSQPHPKAGIASDVDAAGAPAVAIPTPAGIESCWHAAQPTAPSIERLINKFFIALIPCAVIAAENVCLVDRFLPANTSRILKR